MLLNFEVKNYLSFKDTAWFSMESNKKIRTLKDNKNIIKLKSWEIIWLNKTAVFYGANASWKTNIFKWIDFLKFITLKSFKFDIEWGIRHQFLQPFLLDEKSQKENIVLEIEFIIEKIRYKYLLELNEKEIVKEKLVSFEKIEKNWKEKVEEIVIIDRDDENLTIEESYFWFNEEEFERLDLFPRDNQTLISIFANRDGKWKYLATKIIKFFLKLNFLHTKSDYTGFTASMLKDEEIKEVILDFMNNADINIEDIRQEERDVRENEKNIIEINWKRIIPDKVMEIVIQHPVYNSEKKSSNVWFELNQESQWTQKLFCLLWPILHTIENNGVLLIDEIDSHMHILLVENLVKFFHWVRSDWKNNIWESQFIFNTHHLDLMDLEIFKKDQIYFTSKDYYWATEMYSLDDFKEIQIRNNSDIKKAYKFWVFWAIPILSDFNL